MADGAETELKFDLDPPAVDGLQQRLAALAGPVPASPAQTLHSVYYDTPGRELQAAGFVLRVRKSGDRRVQTVKRDIGALIQRGEWECDLDALAPDLEAAARTPMGPVLGAVHGRVQPIFATRVQRAVHLIHTGGAEVEAAVDRGEVEAGGRTAPICELELELKAGDPAALFDLARALSGDTALRLNFESKAERGYRLLDHAAPEAAHGPLAALAPGMTVREAFRVVAAAALRQMTANATVLRAARRPEALHQMRVALRRMRTAFKLFEDAVADKDCARLQGELKWLTGELDQARDIDVLIEQTFRPAAQAMHDQAGLADLGRRLHGARSGAYDRAIGAIEGERYPALLIDLAAWLEGGRWSRPDDPLFGPRADAAIEEFARAGLDKLRRQVKRRGRALKTLDAGSRHKLRIRAKRLRYAIEFFGGLYAKRDRGDLLKALKAFQDTLGALNDLAVARERGLAFAQAGGQVSGEDDMAVAQQAFAVGLMVGARAGGEAKMIKTAQRQYEAVISAKRFWR